MTGTFYTCPHILTMTWRARYPHSVFTQGGIDSGKFPDKEDMWHSWDLTPDMCDSTWFLFPHTMLLPTWSLTPSHSFYKGDKAQRRQVSGRGHRWISGRVKSRSISWYPWLGFFPLSHAMSGQVPLKRKMFCRVTYMVHQLQALW